MSSAMSPLAELEVSPAAPDGEHQQCLSYGDQFLQIHLFARRVSEAHIARPEVQGGDAANVRVQAEVAAIGRSRPKGGAVSLRSTIAAAISSMNG